MLKNFNIIFIMFKNKENKLYVKVVCGQGRVKQSKLSGERRKHNFVSEVMS